MEEVPHHYNSWKYRLGNMLLDSLVDTVGVHQYVMRQVGQRKEVVLTQLGQVGQREEVVQTQLGLAEQRKEVVLHQLGLVG